MNLYGFVFNQSINFTDFLGLELKLNDSDPSKFDDPPPISDGKPTISDAFNPVGLK